MGVNKKRSRCFVWGFIMLLLVLLSLGWFACRRAAALPSAPPAPSGSLPYSEQQQVPIAMALSYLAYGYQGELPSAGTVSELIDAGNIGILQENAGVCRANPEDSSTALLSALKTGTGCDRFYRSPSAQTKKQARSGLAFMTAALLICIRRGHRRALYSNQADGPCPASVQAGNQFGNCVAGGWDASVAGCVMGII